MISAKVVAKNLIDKEKKEKIKPILRKVIKQCKWIKIKKKKMSDEKTANEDKKYTAILRAKF